MCGFNCISRLTRRCLVLTVYHDYRRCVVLTVYHDYRRCLVLTVYHDYRRCVVLTVYHDYRRCLVLTVYHDSPEDVWFLTVFSIFPTTPVLLFLMLVSEPPPDDRDVLDAPTLISTTPGSSLELPASDFCQDHINLPFTPWLCLEASPSEFRMMPWGIIWSPPHRLNGNYDTASSIIMPPYTVFFWSKNIIFILSFYTLNDGFDLALLIILC